MKPVVGVGLTVAAVLGFELAIFRLAEIGTCASGGPYVIGNECPEGTGWWVALLLVSALLTLPATVLLPPYGEDKERGRRAWMPVFVFIPGMRECALFCLLTAAVVLAAEAGNDNAIIAGALAVLGPAAWLVGRWLSRLAERPT